MDPMIATPGERLISTSTSGFRRRLSGTALSPGDLGYDEARHVWNGLIDRHPAVIVRCASSTDVAAAIAFAREHELPLAVRGGGHSAAGFGVCDGGVVVDLSAMRAVDVDPVGKIATVGGGATWADVDASTQAHNLAVTGGLVTHTGVGGLTLGGGLGNLMRRCGLTCDNVVGMDLVTADGRTVSVGENDHPELLWGLKGGGGNFGVVTRFTYRLHMIGPTVVAGAILYPLAAGRDVLRFYRDWAVTLPDEMTTVVALRSAPASPHIPAQWHGVPVVAVAVCWSGDVGAGDRVLEPLRRFRRPLADGIRPKPYVEHQAMFDASAPHGRRNYKRNTNVIGLTDDLIDVLLEYTERKLSPLSMTLIFQLGGAVSRMAEDSTAYSDRAAAYNIDINAQWLHGDDPLASQYIQWVRDFNTALGAFSSGGAYVNFLMGDEGEHRTRSTYGRAHHDRLVALKRVYDPDNVFRLNHNIDPFPPSSGE